MYFFFLPFTGARASRHLEENTINDYLFFWCALSTAFVFYGASPYQGNRERKCS